MKKKVAVAIFDIFVLYAFDDSFTHNRAPQCDVDTESSDNCENEQIDITSICLFFSVLSIRLYSLNVISDYL